ncbi:hypothetical protein BVX97_03615 [bacterium E08(2017)]|nr:hypothetical protein BVX97_03615 [bacterium E08(2017)]
MRPHSAIKGQSDNLGPLLPLPCSDCEETKWFNLTKHAIAANLLGMKLSKHTAYSLHCSKCNYSVDIAKDDIEKALSFLPVALKYSSGSITESVFNEELAKADFGFLKEIAAANTYWQCKECGEESPVTFPSCWNCGHMNENPPSATNENKPNTPHLDKALKNKGGPFGGINL